MEEVEEVVFVDLSTVRPRRMRVAAVRVWGSHVGAAAVADACGGCTMRKEEACCLGCAVLCATTTVAWKRDGGPQRVEGYMK